MAREPDLREWADIPGGQTRRRLGPRIDEYAKAGRRRVKDNPTLGRVGQQRVLKVLGVPAQARMISIGDCRAGEVVVNTACGVRGVRRTALQEPQAVYGSPPNGLELSRSAARARRLHSRVTWQARHDYVFAHQPSRLQRVVGRHQTAECQ